MTDATAADGGAASAVPDGAFDMASAAVNGTAHGDAVEVTAAAGVC